MSTKIDADEVVIVETNITHDVYEELEAYIKSLPEVSAVKFRIRKMAAVASPGHLPQMWDFVVHLSKVALPHLKKDGETIGVNAASAWLLAKIKNYVDGRNEEKKKQIETGNEKVLLYDADGNVIKIDQKD